MTTLFTDAGKAIDSACDAVYDTVASWFADEKPEVPSVDRAQLEALMAVMAEMVAMQKALGAKDVEPPQS